MCLLFFINFFFFTKWQPFKNYEKCFLFHVKISFCSQDIQIFVFLSSSLFFPVSHCFRSWFKKNLKFYGVIICLNKSLITRFVWYLEKEIWCVIETLSTGRVLNIYGTFLWEKSCRKCAPKVSPRPLFNFAK